jgi:hypothetical protein
VIQWQLNNLVEVLNCRMGNIINMFIIVFVCDVGQYMFLFLSFYKSFLGIIYYFYHCGNRNF